MFGTKPVTNEGHAYNWMIKPEDHTSIVFFEYVSSEPGLVIIDHANALTLDQAPEQHFHGNETFELVELHDAYSVSSRITRATTPTSASSRRDGGR